MTKSHKVQDIASEYRFDYKKAKPNRFANKMNLNVNWTVEKFVAEEKKESGKKPTKAKAKKVAKAKPTAKNKPTAKKASKPVKKKK